MTFTLGQKTAFQCQTDIMKDLALASEGMSVPQALLAGAVVQEQISKIGEAHKGYYIQSERFRQDAVNKELGSKIEQGILLKWVLSGINSNPVSDEPLKRVRSSLLLLAVSPSAVESVIKNLEEYAVRSFSELLPQQKIAKG